MQQTQSQDNAKPVSVAVKYYYFFKEKEGPGNQQEFSQLRNKWRKYFRLRNFRQHLRILQKIVLCFCISIKTAWV
jgi:hypothetical protein